MKLKRPFTLLEIALGIAILGLVSSFVVVKMNRLIDRKGFDSDVERIESRIFICRRLALNMQADWTAVLEKRKDRSVFTAVCSENGASYGLPPAKLRLLGFFFNGEKLDSLSFQFSGTGQISPKGLLQIIDDRTGQKREWNIPDVFYIEESQKGGPLHPEDLLKTPP